MHDNPSHYGSNGLPDSKVGLWRCFDNPNALNAENAWKRDAWGMPLSRKHL